MAAYTGSVPLWKKSAEPTELSAAHADQARVADDPARPAGKGRPTPKRKDAEAANRRPLVGSAKQARTPEEKAKARADRQAAREAMLRGDERYLTERDRGPERRFLRDAVDARLSIGEFLLPVMITVLALSLLPLGWARTASFFVAYGLMIFAIIDSWLLWRRVKGMFVEQFGHLPGKGSAPYVVLRAFQMRGSRIPRPALKRGDTPRRR